MSLDTLTFHQRKRNHWENFNEIKGLDKCKELRSIIIANTNISNLNGLFIKPGVKITVEIRNTNNIFTFPNFPANTKFKYLGFKDLTLESLAPIVDLSIDRYCWFQNVVVINPLTNDEKLRLINNPNISFYTKERLLYLSMQANPKIQ